MIYVCVCMFVGIMIHLCAYENHWFVGKGDSNSKHVGMSSYNMRNTGDRINYATVWQTGLSENGVYHAYNSVLYTPK